MPRPAVTAPANRSRRGRLVVGLGLLALLVVVGVLRRPARPVAGGPGPAARAAALLAEARRLRIEHAPGWRTASLELLTQAAALKPARDLRQEVVFTLAAADLRPLPWIPPGPAAPLLLDLARDRYVTATPEGIVSFRSLRDHTELFRQETDATPVARFLEFSEGGQWLALLGTDGALRFRRCDAGAGAALGPGRQPGPNAAAFNLEGKRVVYTGGGHANAERFLTLSPTVDISQRRFVELPGRTGPFAWSPSETQLAVLILDPPALAVVNVGLGSVTATLPLDGTPTALAWMPDARKVMCSTSNGVFLVDTTDEQVESFAPGLNGINSLTLDAGGHLLATARADGRVQIWDVPARRQLTEVTAPAERVEFSEDGRQLVLYAAGQTRASLWEFSNPREFVHYLQITDRGLPMSTNAPGLRLDPHGLWLEPGTNGVFQLPAAGAIKGIARSKNEAWIHVHLADGGVQEWNLPRLKERLESLGLEW